jgi:hypothetical protein
MAGAMEATTVELERQIIEVARDFSKVPGGRFARLGPYSGEEFRQKVLLPALRRARSGSGPVVVRLDGTAGYPASFLEEAFGGLVRLDGFTAEELRRILIIEAEAQRFQVRRDMAWSYIEAADPVRH